MEPLPFGSYRLLEHLATGGMADIYLAEPLAGAAPEQRVVVKRIRADYQGSAEFRSMFLEEARLMALVHHDNVVRVLDRGEVDGSPFMALEYVRGMDLRTLLVESSRLGGMLPLGIAAGIVRDVARGLHAAHTAGDDSGRPLRLIHRDVCPHNILLGYDGQVRITDFGIAHEADASGDSRPGQLTGRVGYLSPELCDGLAVDARSDVFSLGIVLYEATTGRRLFKGPSRIETQLLVKQATVPPPTSIDDEYPPALEEIVLQALARRPEDRHADAESLADALTRFLEEEGEEAGAPAVGRYLQTLARSAGMLPPSSDPLGAPPQAAAPTAPAGAPAPGPLKAPPPDPEAEAAAARKAAPPPPTATVDLPQQGPVAASHAIPILAPDEADDIFYGLEVGAGEVKARRRALLTVLVVVLGVAAVALLMHYRSAEQEEMYAPSAPKAAVPRPEAPPMPKTTAVLLVNSVPARARVYVDYAPQLHKTPCEIPIVAGVAHTLYVEHPLFYPVRYVTEALGEHRSSVIDFKEVKLLPEELGQRRNLPNFVRLDEHAPRGVVHIESAPPGVDVWAGEKLLGQTPLPHTELLAWEEQILRFEREGLTPAHHLLLPQAGLEMAIRAELAPVEVDRNRFDLTVYSNPEDAILYVDGERKGRTPYFDRYWRGSHLTVRLEREGYDPYERTVTLDGSSITIHALLQQRLSHATLNVRSNRKAVLYVDGEELGTTPAKLSVTSGVHEVVLQTVKEGQRASFKVELEPGEVLRRKVVFAGEGGYNVE